MESSNKASARHNGSVTSGDCERWEHAAPGVLKPSFDVHGRYWAEIFVNNLNERNARKSGGTFRILFTKLVVRLATAHLLPEHVSVVRHLRTECERRVSKREGGAFRGDHEDEARRVIIFVTVPVNPESPERLDGDLRGSSLAVFREPESSLFWVESEMNKSVWHSRQKERRPSRG